MASRWSRMLPMGARSMATKTRNKRMRIKHDHDLSAPWDIPVISYCGYKPGNIFETRNSTSKYIALNRPEALNALSLDMINHLSQIYDDAKNDPFCKVVMLYGASEKAFCAGGDVAALARMGPVPMGQPCPQMEFFRREYNLNHKIHTLMWAEPSKTHLGVMSGITMGGGAGLVCNAHFNLATDDTLFAMPECGIGFFPDVGASWWLTRKTFARTGLYNLGIYLALTGRRLNGMETYKTGISTHYITLGAIPRLQHNFMFQEFGDLDDVMEKLEMYTSAPDPSEAGDDNISPHFEAIERCFAHKTVEEIRSALKAEIGASVEHGQWANEALTLMNKASPTSLAVTLEAMRDGFNPILELGHSLTQDLRMARRFMAGEDFFEGIRAALVDKDNKPRWSPAPTRDQVLEYFEPLPEDEELKFDDAPPGGFDNAEWQEKMDALTKQ